MEDSQEFTRSVESPLFEPTHSPPPPYQHPSIAEAVMINTTTLPAVASEVQVEEEIKPFVQRLRDLEAAAKAKMATWDPMFLGSDQEDTKIPVGTKRKGKLCCKYC
jgi:hypothetical protein